MNELTLPEKNYFSISEVSRITRVRPYILRYWESEFKLLRPLRRESGQRKYTRKDIEFILKIRELLYEKKYRIEGAKEYLLSQKRKGAEQLSLELEKHGVAVDFLKEVKKELEEITKILKTE